MDELIKYVQDNLLFFIIVGACLLAIIVICSVLAVSTKNAKKNQMLATAEPAPAEENALNVEETEPEVEVEPEIKAEPEPQTEPEPEPEHEPEPEPEPEPEEEISLTATQPDQAQGGEKTVKAGYAGKWTISKMAVVDDNGQETDSAFYFQLKASNGESLITSEDYTTLRGATQGIETFKANAARGNFKISISKKGKFIVKLLTNQGALLTQGEKYNTRAQALSAVQSIQRFAQTAVLSDDVQTIHLPYQEATAPTEQHYDASKKGKWVTKKIILDGENQVSYYFELRASNGQVLLTSEEYSTMAGLKNGIATHKSNIERGNIGAVITRNGDYIFKVYTANGQLLCLGEHYATKQLCLNAIESVKRFAKTAELN
ncbi:MAG: DUF1508 domain-containing protein [Clostridia bacterium]|nr:DUF1508 domain-containing protein [Clostridia bacterium]